MLNSLNPQKCVILQVKTSFLFAFSLIPPFIYIIFIPFDYLFRRLDLVYPVFELELGLLSGFAASVVVDVPPGLLVSVSLGGDGPKMISQHFVQKDLSSFLLNLRYLNQSKERSLEYSLTYLPSCYHQMILLTEKTTQRVDKRRCIPRLMSRVSRRNFLTRFCIFFNKIANLIRTKIALILTVGLSYRFDSLACRTLSRMQFAQLLCLYQCLKKTSFFPQMLKQTRTVFKLFRKITKSKSILTLG